ncbi:MAG: hypothetical protein VR70_10710 [Rhodospirillaceae bacterium BRH_c57]|nr:MAG: hypothetical protein VR70_10710 [Rhodospirillaceae bacterium BRH_c57]
MGWTVSLRPARKKVDGKFVNPVEAFEPRPALPEEPLMESVVAPTWKKQLSKLGVSPDLGADEFVAMRDRLNGATTSDGRAKYDTARIDMWVRPLSDVAKDIAGEFKGVFLMVPENIPVPLDAIPTSQSGVFFMSKEDAKDSDNFSVSIDGFQTLSPKQKIGGKTVLEERRMKPEKALALADELASLDLEAVSFEWGRGAVPGDPMCKALVAETAKTASSMLRFYAERGFGVNWEVD